jgi:hypothetical protein
LMYLKHNSISLILLPPSGFMPRMPILFSIAFYILDLE